jgi:hypothetical protein
MKPFRKKLRLKKSRPKVDAFVCPSARGRGRGGYVKP